MKNILKKISNILRKTLLALIATIVVVSLFVIGVVWVVFKGPSSTASDLLAMSLKETSAMKWVPELFFTDEEILAIAERNTVVITTEVTDTSMVNIDSDSQGTGEAIEIIDLVGSTYKGKVMIIKDPSKVFVGTKGEYDGTEGKTGADIAGLYGAKAAINGGGFSDVGGQGNGGMPEGFVISKGVLEYGSQNSEYITLGFTNENKFVVGVMTANEAINLNMRDAVCVSGVYAPPLIVNGQAQEVQGLGGGLNPRTAIGQREDGAVILVVIDGRQANSLGASFADMLEIMEEYGAVNAGSLDGGNSSQMSYMGELLNSPSRLGGAREIPTAFVVE